MAPPCFALEVNAFKRSPCLTLFKKITRESLVIFVVWWLYKSESVSFAIPLMTNSD